MSLGREMRDLYRYFFKLNPEKKTILFYSEAGSYYSYMEGAIEELLSRGEHICYVTSDLNDPIFDKESELLTPLYQKSLLPYFMLYVNSPVCVMTLTELHRHHIKRSINKTRYIYLFHALVSTHMMYREGSFDHYDMILCVSPYQIAEIRKREKDEGLPKKELIEGSYYRLERIHQTFQNRAPSTEEKKTILIAPSWGDKNILNTGGKELTGLLLEEGHKVIFRPHPELFKQSADLIEELVQAYDSNPDFTLERSTAGDESMLCADVLIVDWSGIALEYAFGTERPVLSMDLPMKAKNPDHAKLGLEPFEATIREQIGLICPGVKEAPEMIRELLEKKSDYTEQIRALREEHIPHFGQSSVIAADTILRNT